jgi:rubrerythrin
MTPVHPETLTALNAGIQSEVAAYVFYIEAAKKSEAAQFKEILEKLAGEEKTHFQVLERQHHSLIRSEKWISTADILKSQGLPEIGEEMSSQHRDLVAEVKKAATAHDILQIAYRLEEEAYDLFHREAGRAKTPEAMKMFEELSKFEQGHMSLIANMMKEYPA